MTSKQVALIQDSFAKVALTSEAAAVLFYDQRELGIRILTPITHWEMLEPWAALWR
jgi:hypothetical protein